jgi:hypothetical protein
MVLAGAKWKTQELTVGVDPKYEEEVSGCTASVGLISKTKIHVVSWLLCAVSKSWQLNRCRQMQVTLGPCLV